MGWPRRRSCFDNDSNSDLSLYDADSDVELDVMRLPRTCVTYEYNGNMLANMADEALDKYSNCANLHRGSRLSARRTSLRWKRKASAT